MDRKAFRLLLQTHISPEMKTSVSQLENFLELTDSRSCLVFCSKANTMNSAHTYILCHSFGATAVNKWKCDIVSVVLCPRSKLQRDQDRDISELIALGVPNPRSASEAQYDQRLFNQSKVGVITITYSARWLVLAGHIENLRDSRLCGKK